MSSVDLGFWQPLVESLLPYQVPPRPGDVLRQGGFDEEPVTGVCPDKWSVWLMSAGRGTGKTLTGSVLSTLFAHAVQGEGVAFAVGPTFSHVCEVMLFKEETSVARVVGDGFIDWAKSRQSPSGGKLPRLVFKSGVEIVGLSAEKPDKFRGYQGSFAWWDEPGRCIYAPQVFQQLGQILRKTPDPKVIMTTTPDSAKSSPSKGLLRALVECGVDPDDEDARARLLQFGGPVTRMLDDGLMSAWTSVAYTCVPSWHNTALPDEWRQAQLMRARNGSAWDRQETMGVLVDLDGSPLLERKDFIFLSRPPSEVREVVVGVDPAVGSGNRDSWGVVSVAKLSSGSFFVLDDRTSAGKPEAGLARIVEAVAFAVQRGARRVRVVVERNQGGLVMVNAVKDALCDAGFGHVGVDSEWAKGERRMAASSQHAKAARAAPLAMGVRARPSVVQFSSGLESSVLVEQLCTWEPPESGESVPSGSSPDAIDAWSLALTALGALGVVAKISGRRRTGRVTPRKSLPSRAWPRG